LRESATDANARASATDASATDATDGTASATAEAVSEAAVKRPRPDADSVPVEQPAADALPSGRRPRRLNVFPPTPRPGFAASSRVTAARLRRDAQQPTPDAEALFRSEALFHEAFGRFREAADAALETRVRANEADGLVENARNVLGFGLTIDQLRKNEKDAAEKTADNARAANIAANAASVCQRTAKDFDHVAHQRAAVADVAAAAARESLAVAGGSGIAADVFETVASANQARAVAQRARMLSNHAVNVLNAALAVSAAADAQRQRAAAFAADAAAAAAEANAEANAANAANEAGDGNFDAVVAAAAAAEANAEANAANAANEAGDGNFDAVVAAATAAAAAAVVEANAANAANEAGDGNFDVVVLVVAAAAAAAVVEANAANAANEAGDGNIDVVAAATAAAAAAAVEANAANAANEAGDGNFDAVVAVVAAAAANAAAAAAVAAADDDDDDENDLIAAAPARDANDAVRADEKKSPDMSIKGSLKTLVCLPGDQGEQFVERLSEIVAVMSKLRVRAFHAVTLFLIRTLQDPELYPDDFFGSLVHGSALAGSSGDKFWREAMRDPERTPRAEPELVISLLREVRHECNFPALIIPDGVCAILNSVAKELSTAFRNHLSENFFERQLQKHRVVVLRLHDETEGGIVDGTATERRKGINELAHWLSRRVNLKVTEDVDFGERDRAATRRFEALHVNLQERLRGHVVAERNALGLAEQDFVSRTWLRSKDPARVMRLLRWTWTALNDIVRFRDDPNLEALRALKLRIRAFCICPQSTIQAAHVPIDAHSFFLLGANLGFWRNDEQQLFTGSDMIKQNLEAFEGELRDQVPGIPERDILKRLRDRRAELKRKVKNRRRVSFWYKVFNVKKLRRGRRKLDFAEHVRTDGVSISVLFHRLDHRSVSPMTKNRLKAEKTLREATADELAMLRIIGIDPGRICLCYGTEEIIAAAPNDEARRLLFEQLAAFDGPPALMNAGAGGAPAAPPAAPAAPAPATTPARTTATRTTATRTTATRTTATRTTATRTTPPPAMATTTTTTTTPTPTTPARTTPASSAPEGVLGLEVAGTRVNGAGRTAPTGTGVARVAAGGAAAFGVPVGATSRTCSRALGTTAAPASTRRRSDLAAGSRTKTLAWRLKPSATLRSRPRTRTCTSGTSTRTSCTTTRCGRRSCIRVGLGRSSACTAGSAGRFRNSSTTCAATARFLLSSRTATPALRRADEASAQSP
jgi:hypothetical protein